MSFSNFEIVKKETIQVKEFNHFFVLNNLYAVLVKHLRQLNVDLHSIDYDELQELKIPRYSYVDSIIIRQLDITWSITEKQWEIADRDMENHLVWFNYYDGTMWDVNLKRLSNAFELDYIEARLSDKYYDLKGVLDHLKKSPLIAKLDAGIASIPTYNRGKGEKDAVYATLTLTQEAFDQVLKESKKSENGADSLKLLGYVCHDRYDAIQKVKEVLGLEQFKK